MKNLGRKKWPTLDLELSDLKLHLITEMLEKLLSGKWIGTVSIGNKMKTFWNDAFDMIECHTHSQNTGTDTSVRRSAIADDRSTGSIHDICMTLPMYLLCQMIIC